MRRWGIDQAHDRLQTTQEWMRLDADWHTRYVGTTRVRGILANQWERMSNATQFCVDVAQATGNRTTVFCQQLVYIEWYFFVASSWSVRGVASSEYGIPVRVEIIGTTADNLSAMRQQGRGSMDNTNKVFHIVYEYTSFYPGKPADNAFLPPVGMKCDSTSWCAIVNVAKCSSTMKAWQLRKMKQPCQEGQKVSSGVAIVMMFGGMLLAFCISGCWHYFGNRKYNKFTPLQDEPSADGSVQMTYIERGTAGGSSSTRSDVLHDAETGNHLGEDMMHSS